MWFVNTVDAKNENDTDAEIIFVPALINGVRTHSTLCDLVKCAWQI